MKVIGSEFGPFPSILVAITVMETPSIEERQGDTGSILIL